MNHCDWFHHIDRFDGPAHGKKDLEPPAEPLVTRRERERAPVQDTVDLHGLKLEEAKNRLVQFVQSSRRKGYRKVLVIHGKGLHSPGGEPVLKPGLQEYFKKIHGVEAFGAASKDQGGQGASWLWLR